MYGDSDTIRGLAARLRQRADEIRATADRLGTRTRAVTWSGLAATSFRERAAQQLADLRDAATEYDEAARALERHADEVDRLKAAIARIEQRVRGLIADARDRVGTLAADLIADPVDLVLSTLSTPPSGHRDWLTVEVPGVTQWR